MAIRIFLLLTLCFLWLYNAHGYETLNWGKKHPKILGISWSNCGPSSDPDQIKSLTISPDPVLVPGNITLGTSFSLAKDLPTDLQISLTIQKKGPFGVWVKIPCIGNIGSCTYSNLCTNWPQICPKYFEKYGIPCTCPIPANTYSVPDAIIDITTKLPPEATGEIRVTVNLMSPSAGHLGCVFIDLNLQT